MVPEVDKLDTHNDLDAIRTQVETIRQEVINLVFEEAHGEKLALQKLATRSLQQARQWISKTLNQLGLRANPYPNSSDSSTQTIDPTTVPQIELDAQRLELSIVQRIKQARADLNALDVYLEGYVAKLIPGSRFNSFFLEAQKHLLQAGMWLGELLAQHMDTTPKSEAEAPIELHKFEDIKDEFVGAVGTPEREAYEQNLTTEVAELPKADETEAPGESESPSTESSTQPVSTTGNDNESGTESLGEMPDAGTEPTSATEDSAPDPAPTYGNDGVNK